VAELIVAFDMPSGRDALLLAARLPGLKWAKLGPVLFVREGPPVIKEFKERGIQVFLDFKWHDIPNIVAKAVVSSACRWRRCIVWAGAPCSARPRRQRVRISR